MKHIAILDCATNQRAYSCLNRLNFHFNYKFSYHHIPSRKIDIKELPEVSAYIIFGSSSNVDEKLPWQINLKEFALDKLNNNIPIMGICFGHQLLADAFGADVVLAKETHKGIREMQMSNKSIKLFVSHSYEVKNISEDLINLATSNECEHEMLRHKSLPFFSIQAHPEASLFFVEEIIKKDYAPELTSEVQHFGNNVMAHFFDNYIN